MSAESTEPIKRWTAKRRGALVVSTLKGEASVDEAAPTHRLVVLSRSSVRPDVLRHTL